MSIKFLPVEPTHEMLEAIWGRALTKMDEGVATKIARAQYDALRACVPDAPFGKRYRHRDGRLVDLIAVHPHDGATLVVEDVDRVDGEICVFTICERSDLTPFTEACPHCRKPAEGWLDCELRNGFRWENGAKVYHCREATIAD